MDETNTPQPSSPHSWLKLIVVLVILAVVGAVLVKYKNNINLGNLGGSKQPGLARPASGVAVKDVDKSQLPAGFPKDFPLEQGAQVINNYNAIGADGRTQATREFTSAKTADQNYELYLNFFKSNGWNVILQNEQMKIDPKVAAQFKLVQPKTDTSGQKMLSATKEKTAAQVVITGNVVQISLTFASK